MDVPPFTRMTSRSPRPASSHRAGWTCRAGPSARTMIVELVAGGGAAGPARPAPAHLLGLGETRVEDAGRRIADQVAGHHRLGRVAPGWGRSWRRGKPPSGDRARAT